MNKDEKIGWELAQMEHQSGKKRNQKTLAELNEQAGAAYDECWTAIEHNEKYNRGNNANKI